MNTAADWLLAFVALYPVLTAALWVAGGMLFKLLDEEREEHPPQNGWPGVTILIPAYNEAAVIATSVTAALASDYPDFEVMVLDDGSTDETQAAALAAADGDRRAKVVRDPVNRGKAEQLNRGFAASRHPFVIVTDADAHMHPHAARHLVSRIHDAPIVAAVAGAPHVTNRGRLICAMQVLEASAIIGLIRRTQSLTGRVGVVAGVLGIFRRERVLEVGGYDPRMATEDIELTWRLLMAGNQTAYEPRAIVGMEVPTTLRALWAQRTRWARGQGEVLHEHLDEVLRWRNRRMWLLSTESLASLIWVMALALALVFSVLNVFFGDEIGAFAFGLAWGIAISVVATLQLSVAIALGYEYDRYDLRAFLVGALYPPLFWIASASAALRSQIGAAVRGPRDRRVVWDIQREDVAPRVTDREPADP